MRKPVEGLCKICQLYGEDRSNVEWEAKARLFTKPDLETRRERTSV